MCSCTRNRFVERVSPAHSRLEYLTLVFDQTVHVLQYCFELLILMQTCFSRSLLIVTDARRVRSFTTDRVTGSHSTQAHTKEFRRSTRATPALHVEVKELGNRCLQTDQATPSHVIADKVSSSPRTPTQRHQVATTTKP